MRASEFSGAFRSMLVRKQERDTRAGQIVDSMSDYYHVGEAVGFGSGVGPTSEDIGVPLGRPGLSLFEAARSASSWCYAFLAETTNHLTLSRAVPAVVFMAGPISPSLHRSWRSCGARALTTGTTAA